MAAEAILTAAGRVHRGWKEVRVVRSLERLAGSFELTLTDRWAAGDAVTVIVPGQACSLSLAGVPVITGDVDEVRPSISATAHEIRVSGRDVAGDLVDCAPDYRPGEWRASAWRAWSKRWPRPSGSRCVYWRTRVRRSRSSGSNKAKQPGKRSNGRRACAQFW